MAAGASLLSRGAPPPLADALARGALSACGRAWPQALLYSLVGPHPHSLMPLPAARSALAGGHGRRRFFTLPWGPRPCYRSLGPTAANGRAPALFICAGVSPRSPLASCPRA